MVEGRIPETGQIVNTAGVLGLEPFLQKSEILYVNKVPDDGWLRTLYGKTDVYLYKYTKVKVVEFKKGRTYFKVLDGSSSGKTLSLMDANAKEYLGRTPPTLSALEVVVTYGKYEEGWYSKAKDEYLNQQWAKFEFDGTYFCYSIDVTMNSVWGKDYSPLQAGEYTILLPDSPHNKNMTRFYRDFEPKLKYDQVWFPISYGDNSRYVHVGNVSEGCVTIVNLASWADIHDELISHRANDGKSVGKLTVNGKPEREK